MPALFISLAGRNLLFWNAMMADWEASGLRSMCSRVFAPRTAEERALDDASLSSAEGKRGCMMGVGCFGIQSGMMQAGA
jgi:hypothetical protein